MALALVFAGGRISAQGLSTADPNHELARFGLGAKAERVVHRGRPYLLVTLSPTHLRMRAVTRDRGVTEFVPLNDGGFLPLEIACDGMAVEVDGQRLAPDPLSPCRRNARFVSTGSRPVFAVFPWPRPGAVRVTIPVTVLESPPPSGTAGGVASGRSPEEQRPTGAHALVMSVLVEEPKSTR